MKCNKLGNWSKIGIHYIFAFLSWIFIMIFLEMFLFFYLLNSDSQHFYLNNRILNIEKYFIPWQSVSIQLDVLGSFILRKD